MGTNASSKQVAIATLECPCGCGMPATDKLNLLYTMLKEAYGDELTVLRAVGCEEVAGSIKRASIVFRFTDPRTFEWDTTLLLKAVGRMRMPVRVVKFKDYLMIDTDAVAYEVAYAAYPE